MPHRPHRLSPSVLFACTLCAFAALALAAVAGAQPPPDYDPGPKDKNAIGWVVSAPCLGDDEAPFESSAARAAACPPSFDRPALLEAANGEVYLLNGLSADERQQLAQRQGRPVQLSGTFAWHGRLRTLEVAAIEAVTDEAADAARRAPPEYQMQQYFMTFLKPGPAQKDIEDAQRAELMKGHFGHIETQAAAGTLLLAGPFGEQKPERRISGIYIYAVETLEEAEALSAEDPSVAAGYFEAATIPWYGAASLGY
ncbi:MAG: YciI family protein [Acidobacteriota bacterium]